MSKDYARQLAAHPRWTWQSGMVTRAGSVDDRALFARRLLELLDDR